MTGSRHRIAALYFLPTDHSLLITGSESRVFGWGLEKHRTGVRHPPNRRRLPTSGKAGTREDQGDCFITSNSLSTDMDSNAGS